MFDFQSFILALESWGLIDVLLPFLLIFIVIFASLQKTEILGKDKKNFNVIVSIIVALLVIVPHVMGTYPGGFDVVDIINTVIPQISLIIVGILMLMMLLGLFAGSEVPMVVAGIAAIIVVLILIGSTGWLYGLDWLYDFFGTEAVSFFIILIEYCEYFLTILLH